MLEFLCPIAGSVGIHEAMGFEPVGVFDKVGYKFDGWHDVGYWALRLCEPSAEPTPQSYRNFCGYPALVRGASAGWR